MVDGVQYNSISTRLEEALRNDKATSAKDGYGGYFTFNTQSLDAYETASAARVAKTGIGIAQSKESQSLRTQMGTPDTKVQGEVLLDEAKEMMDCLKKYCDINFEQRGYGYELVGTVIPQDDNGYPMSREKFLEDNPGKPWNTEKQIANFYGARGKEQISWARALDKPSGDEEKKMHRCFMDTVTKELGTSPLLAKFSAIIKKEESKSPPESPDQNEIDKNKKAYKNEVTRIFFDAAKKAADNYDGEEIPLTPLESEPKQETPTPAPTFGPIASLTWNRPKDKEIDDEVENNSQLLALTYEPKDEEVDDTPPPGTPPTGNPPGPPPPDDNTKVGNDVKTTTIAKFEGPVVNLREEGLVDKAGNRLRDLAKNPAFKGSIGDSIENFAKNNVAGYSGLLPHQQRRIQRAIAATIMSIERSSNPPGVNLDDLNPQALKTTLLVSASRAKTMDKLGSVQISNNPPKEGQEGCTGLICNIYADFIKAFSTDNKEAATGAGKLLEECLNKAGFNAEEANALHEKLNKSGQEVLKYTEGGDMMDILKSMRDTLKEDDDPKLKKLERKLADEIDKSFQLKRDNNLPMLISKLPFSKRPKVDKALKKLEIALDGNYSQRSIDKLFEKIDFMVEQKTKTSNNDALEASDKFMRTATQPLREFVDRINEQLPATSTDPNIQQLRAKILKPITQHVRKNTEVMDQRVAAFKNCRKDGRELVSTYSQKELPKGKNLGPQQHMGDFLSKAKYDTHITAYTSLGESISKFDNDFRLLNNLPEMTHDLESTQKLAEEGSKLAKEGPNLVQETPQKFSFAIRNIMHRAKPSEGEGQLSLGDTLNKLDPELKNTAVTILKEDVAHNPHPELTEKALEFAYASDRTALREYCNEIGDEQADQLLETIAYLESGKDNISSEEIQKGKQNIWVSIFKQDTDYNKYPQWTEKALELTYDNIAGRIQPSEYYGAHDNEEIRQLTETAEYITRFKNIDRKQTTTDEQPSSNVS